MMSLKRKLQPSWTIYLFKISFSVYMLVSVIVLINLLIAMMSDTYQSIVAQSDIEWKYGLSKLVRNMQKARTAPSPLNLLTTWTTWLHGLCKARKEKSKRASVMRGFIGHRSDDKGRLFTVGEMLKNGNSSGRGFSRFVPSAADSRLSLRERSGIDKVVDWSVVGKKYRMRFGNEVVKPSALQ